MTQHWKYSYAVPKPVYKSPEALEFWDLPVYVKHSFIKANRVDTQFGDHKNKVWAVKMSRPWLEHLEMKSEKMVKYIRASGIWAEETVP